MTASLSLLAPAKINLFLKVLGKRSDGYHDLSSWMQKVDLFDYISLRIKNEGGVTCHCSEVDVPTGEANLAARAAHVFFTASTRARGYGVEIRVEKNIPVAAGLGGGSSDAGTVLKALNDFFDHEFNKPTLIRMATKLGADVPFFVLEETSIHATGIGEIMEPMAPMDNCSFILVNPGISVSTAWVFHNLSLTSNTKNSRLLCSRKHNSARLRFAELENDLEQVTCARYPIIDRIKSSLLRAGAAKVLMSGSGPTVFGIFPDQSKADDESGLHVKVEKLRQEFGEKVFKVRAYTGASPSGKAPGFDPGIS